METSKLHHLDGYDYHLGAYITTEGSFRGMILFTASSGKPLIPHVKIPTPTTFRSDRAARIEASALAFQLIHTGAINVLLPHHDAQAAPAAPQPTQPNDSFQ
jgi:hypothetical protein